MNCSKCHNLKLTEYERTAEDGKPVLVYECDCKGNRVVLRKHPKARK